MTGICVWSVPRPGTCTIPKCLPGGWTRFSGMNDPGTGALLRPVIAAHVPAARGALLAAAACLAACASLPGSGPSARDIQESGAGVIRVVDVDDSVVKRLLERRADRPFSEAFETAPARGEIVRPGDVLEISVWEAPATVLFSPGIPLAVPTQAGRTSGSPRRGTTANAPTLL